MIVAQELEKLKTRLQARNITLIYPASILSFVSETAFIPAEGARPIRKKIERDIEQPIAEFLLTHPKHKKLSLTIKDKKIKVK